MKRKTRVVDGLKRYPTMGLWIKVPSRVKPQRRSVGQPIDRCVTSRLELQPSLWLEDPA
jgi:hypothetical protein